MNKQKTGLRWVLRDKSNRFYTAEPWLEWTADFTKAMFFEKREYAEAPRNVYKKKDEINIVKVRVILQMLEVT